MKSEMLNWLRNYIQVTPQSEIKKQWKSIEDMNFEGPKAFEYIEQMKQLYCYDSSPEHFSQNINIPILLTPKFSESFF